MSRALRRLARRDALEPLRVPLPAGLLDVLRKGPAPLVPAGPQRATLRVAVVVPTFRKGSGGHATIVNLVRGLEELGHECSLWLIDVDGRHADESEAETADLFRTFFGSTNGSLRKDFSAWEGADVAVATGWQTVPTTLLLNDVAARAYLVQDHEPDFYGASAERSWAEWTYRQPLHCICASSWLASTVSARYGASVSSFELGVDHRRYRPLPTHRRDDLILFYARAVTPRRAVPLGLLALEELHLRRPDVEIALFGEARELVTPFPHRHLGVLDPERLAHAYASATVGLVLSLTNPSLVPQEMLACGLPVVDVASESMIAGFGYGGPLELVEPDPLHICAGLERLLDDLALRADRSRAGAEWVADRTWPAAAAQVDAALRAALSAAGAA
jgi:glycosyltransferase involved in cell wall biosynthesis